MLPRRTLLAALTLAGGALTLSRAFASAASGSIAAIREGWRALLPPDVRVPKADDPEPRKAAEWRAQLEPERFRILFEDGTERPFSSPLNDEKRPGVFVCAACALPLFSSQMKYDSGTGWPSFFTHVPGHLGTRKDFKLVWPRTEYHCVRCGGHQGHVFGDGPPPTGERWCNNGLALRFLAAKDAGTS